MAFHLDSVVPWGRSYSEYVSMFRLSKRDLQSKILGCADGPSSFNAELTQKKGAVTSFDPIYEFSRDQIQTRIHQVYPAMMKQAEECRNEFVWSNSIPDPATLGLTRMRTMTRFLDDFEIGLAENRYLKAELPFLPLEDGSYDLALCSHFLFLYSNQLSTQFHIDSVMELLRVSAELRIFPIIDLQRRKSTHLEPVMHAVRERSFEATIVEVEYEFQKGGNQMLRITTQKPKNEP